MRPSSTFISYSKVDEAFALKLASQLKSEGINIWIDQQDIAPGARWDREIEAAMMAADCLLVVLSPTSTASENVQDEIGLAFDAGKRILPVLCKPCEVPMRLRRLQHIDFTQDYDKAFERLLVAARLPAAPAAARPQGAPTSSTTAHAASVLHTAAPTVTAAPASGKRTSMRNIGIGVVLLAAAAGAVYKVTRPGPTSTQAQCDQVGTLRSVDGDAQTLEVQNNLANPVNLYWIDHGGQLQKMTAIPPNEVHKQDTFEGHYWVIKDIRNQCLTVVKAPAKVTLP